MFLGFQNWAAYFQGETGGRMACYGNVTVN